MKELGVCVGLRDDRCRFRKVFIVTITDLVQILNHSLPALMPDKAALIVTQQKSQKRVKCARITHEFDNIKRVLHSIHTIDECLAVR